MKRIEYKTVDKTKWADGEWKSEPDKIQWLDAATQLPCIIVRGPAGALCGYVGISKGHPFYQEKHEDNENIEIQLRVHGGVTFTGVCDGREEDGICHKVEGGEDDKVWWIGFDCAHMWDTWPKDLNDPHMKWHRDTEYRNVEYVTKECTKLAEQLASMT